MARKNDTPQKAAMSASNPAPTYKTTPLTDISGVVFCIQPVTLLPMAISGLASQNLYFLFRHRVWEAL